MIATADLEERAHLWYKSLSEGGPLNSMALAVNWGEINLIILDPLSQMGRVSLHWGKLQDRLQNSDQKDDHDQPVVNV